MRLFKYLIISNDLIENSTIYMLNPNKKQKANKQGGKVTVLDARDIKDYSNDRMIEVFHNKAYSYTEKQIVHFQNKDTKITFPIRNLSYIKDEYINEVKKLIEEGSTDFISMKMFKEDALSSDGKADELTKRDRYISYFCNYMEYEKTRFIRARNENRFYLFKPYEDKPAIVFMSFVYSNTCDGIFKKTNKAYVVIDEYMKGNNLQISNIERLLSLVHAKENGKEFTDGNTEKNYIRAECYCSDSCRYYFKERYCLKDISCKETEGHRFSATTWSTGNSSKSTKRIENSAISLNDGHCDKKKCYDNVEQMQPRSREGKCLIAPNTDGIVTTNAEFYENKIEKTVMTFHQWIKCSSISGKPNKIAKSEICHIGHTFDNRSDYLERLSIEKIPKLRENEFNRGVYRSDYITVGTSYFSNTLNCNCTAKHGDDCKYCEGVFYIKTEQQLKQLYNQLTSDEYFKLKENILL